jgi:hypothetical protein
MSSRLLPLPVLAAGLVVLTACGDPLGSNLNTATFADTLVVYSLSGTPPAYPTAFSSISRFVTRADASFSFDIVFDMDTTGRTLIYPLKLVGGGYAGTRAVGLQKLTGTFDALVQAPSTGYQTDSVVVLAKGEALVMAVTSGSCSIYNPSQTLYTKLVVDSANTVSRQIYFRYVQDPNCGYRSLTPGVVPKN